MIFPKFNLKNRDLYLNKLIAFQDKEPVKVITGIRRCGKSSLMKLMIQHLKNCGISDEQIIFMNFESMEYKNMDSTSLYNYIKDRVINGKKTYLFFDEVQKVEQWQEAINSFRVDFQSDIYITGSNAYLLSSEFSTYLAGRYVEIKMLPLSFVEFIDFNNYTIKDYRSPTGELRKRIYDANGEIYDIEELFEAYLKFGGMPGIADIGLVQDKILTLLDGIYSTIVVRDILEREKRRGQKQITDSDLLRKIIMFLADNIGNNTSITSIGNTLVNEGLIDEGVRKSKPAVKTVQSYVGALLESYVFYEIKRFDIKGKDYLRTLGKYYIVDSGLRNYLLGFRDVDRGHVIENVVYFELLRRGYDVAIGKVGNKEVDFVATKADDKKYIQVTETMAATETKERELTPLKMIRDNYEKIILTMDRNFVSSYDGIKIVNLVDWLVG
ncbi:ATP-binding protein [Lachnospiraceae bacterium MD329]|nr:ATP-binding protein [Lachnospiraceae bacterium MD329]